MIQTKDNNEYNNNSYKCDGFYSFSKHYYYHYDEKTHKIYRISSNPYELSVPISSLYLNCLTETSSSMRFTSVIY